tara:strand:+ start:1137 stop:2129 length:993 start_codon:yes stop_codon:yes gene_type:complete
MIISKTPLRISFAGGGTDLPSFYRNNDYGAVFSSSIDKYIYVTVKDHCGLYPERIRLNYSETEQVNSIEEIENPIIRECLKFLELDERLYISTVADAPGSSGLGSSSSFCVGLLHALYEYKGERVNRARLAEEAAHIEIDVLGRTIGRQDQYAAAFGGLNYIKFENSDSTTITPVHNNRQAVETIFENMLTFWTGIQRASHDILSEQDKRSANNVNSLTHMRDQAGLLLELANSGELTPEKLGNTLHNGWLLKQDLAPSITNKQISAAYEAAISAGALGGKLSGAGGGGFLNLVVIEDRKEAVKDIMSSMSLTHFPIRHDTQGTSVFHLH